MCSNVPKMCYEEQSPKMCYVQHSLKCASYSSPLKCTMYSSVPKMFYVEQSPKMCYVQHSLKLANFPLNSAHLFWVGTQPFHFFFSLILSRLTNVCAGGSCSISEFLVAGTSFIGGVKGTDLLALVGLEELVCRIHHRTLLSSFLHKFLVWHL